MTVEDIMELTPASDGQIRAALALRRIAEIDGKLRFHIGFDPAEVMLSEGYCRPIAPATLASLLQNIISTLSMLDQPTTGFDLAELASSLRHDDDIPEEVTQQTVVWFGNRESGNTWSVRIDDVVSEVGKQILSTYRVSRARNLTCMTIADVFRTEQDCTDEQFHDRMEEGCLRTE